MDLLRELAVYRPWNEQEERDCAELLRRLHITGEQFLLGPQKSQALRFQFQLEPAFFMLGCCPDRIC